MALDLPRTAFTYRQALSRGLSRAELGQALRAGDVHREARGVYAPTLTLDGTGASWDLLRTDHLHRLHVALQRFPGAVASHTSAAVFHGLEIVIAAGSPVELTVVDRSPKSRRHEGLVIHHADSSETPFVAVETIRTTTLPRTVADVLRTRRPPHAVAMTDRAVARGLVTLDAVREELDRQVRWRGRPQARESLKLVDPVRESWLESYSFVTLHARGHPMPLPQVEVYDEHFAFVGRVDGLWPGQRTFGEADGQGKYFLDDGSALDDEGRARSKLYAEAARHRRLEALGLVGVRWTGSEIRTAPDAVVRRVREGMHRGAGMTFRGWVRWRGRFVRLAALPQD